MCAEVSILIGTMPRKAIALLVFLALLSAPAAEARRRSVGGGTDVRTLTPEQWLKMYAKPFATVEAETGFSDLESLRAIVGDARIVSLGEATHGTREFFKMKHRVLEYLVENMGFTVFAIEAALPEADAVNDYVLHGTGDAATALAGMHFWTWNTQEVLDMIEWMRAYNLRRGDRPPVQFRGFDVQFSHGAIGRIGAYLDRVDPSAKAQVTSLWQCWAPYALNSGGWVSRPASERTSCRANLESVRTLLESRRAEYSARSSAAEFEMILRYAVVMLQDEALAAGVPPIRDVLMAENIAWLANVSAPGEKLVLWAHNYHVSTLRDENMGWTLRREFGDDMVVFGFVFDRGSFNAVGPAGLGRQVVDAPASGVETLLRTGAPLSFVDLRDIVSDPAREYFDEARFHWAIGALFTGPIGPYRWGVRLRNAYDVLIWIADTTESKLLQ